MLNLEPLQKYPCKFLFFSLISLKFLMLEKGTSIEKSIFEKRQKGQQFFRGGARAPLAPPPVTPLKLKNKCKCKSKF